MLRSGQNSSKWMALGEYVAVSPRDCVAVLSLSVTLSQRGSVSFQYEFYDDQLIFNFVVSILFALSKG